MVAQEQHTAHLPTAELLTEQLAAVIRHLIPWPANHQRRADQGRQAIGICTKSKGGEGRAVKTSKT